MTTIAIPFVDNEQPHLPQNSLYPLAALEISAKQSLATSL